MKNLEATRELDDKQRRLALNRVAAIKSRKKKKKEELEIRLHVDFLAKTNSHLQSKIEAFEQLTTEQTHLNSLLKAQIEVLNRENEHLKGKKKSLEYL